MFRAMRRTKQELPREERVRILQTEGRGGLAGHGPRAHLCHDSGDRDEILSIAGGG